MANCCPTCRQPVCDKNDGIQCVGPCRKWRHYRCLNISNQTIEALKSGKAELKCPCPSCEKSNTAGTKIETKGSNFVGNQTDYDQTNSCDTANSGMPMDIGELQDCANLLLDQQKDIESCLECLKEYVHTVEVFCKQVRNIGTMIRSNEQSYKQEASLPAANTDCGPVTEAGFASRPCFCSPALNRLPPS